MQKKTAGLMGVIAGLATMGTAQAATHPAPADVLHVSSYAELLRPVANPKAALQASNAALLQKARGAEGVVRVQYDNGGSNEHHHHHHHHHEYAPPPPPPHHHHHHHHQGGLSIVIP